MEHRRWVRAGGLVAACGLALMALGAIEPARAEESGSAAQPALVGAWQFAEDRTPADQQRDPRERPPLGARFRVALEGDGKAVVIEHPRRGVTVVSRVALDGSEDVQQEGTTKRITTGRIEAGVLTMVERRVSEQDGKAQTTTSEYTLTIGKEGLLVRKQVREPIQIDRTALYRRTEDVPAPKAAKGDLAALAWLAGRFTVTETVAQGIQVEMEEHWGPAGGGAMLGTARTVTKGRMASFEFLRIVERDGGLVYVAQPNGGPAVEFVLTELSPTRALFENPYHDYPKRILYERVAAQAGFPDGLRTEISDAGGARAHATTYTRAR